MSMTSSVYGWQSRRTSRDCIEILRKKGYRRVKVITAYDVRVAEAFPERWKPGHRPFDPNPAGVEGL